MSKLRNIAMKSCANWDAGSCLGCMMKCENGRLIIKIDSNYANVPCSVEKGCDYFNNIVVPGLSDWKYHDAGIQNKG